MKPKFISLFLIVIAVSYFGCTKKESVPPAVTHLPTIDPTRISDSTVAVVNKVYPYTDTFVGKLMVTYYDYGGDTIDPNYIFYVYNISRSQKVFMSSVPIDLQSGYVMAIRDTGVLSAGYSYGNMYFMYNVYANAFKFQISGNSLTVDWDVNYIPVIGECDYGESIGHFSGTTTR